MADSPALCLIKETLRCSWLPRVVGHSTVALLLARIADINHPDNKVSGVTGRGGKEVRKTESEREKWCVTPARSMTVEWGDGVLGRKERRTTDGTIYRGSKGVREEGSAADDLPSTVLLKVVLLIPLRCV